MYQFKFRVSQKNQINHEYAVTDSFILALMQVCFRLRYSADLKIEFISSKELLKF